MPVIYSNNASTSLSAGINNSTTTIPIASASGFPSIGSGEYYFGTISNTANTKIEVVKVTSGTTSLTVTRAQGGTSAQAFDSGDNFQLRVTADTLLAATQTDVKITGGSIATAAIADDAVTAAKMAANSIDSDSYVDGSIDHVHLSADCVDGDNIGDDVINSEHIVADSIDAEHLAPNSVNTDAIIDDAVRTAHIQDAQITLAKMSTNSVNTDQYVNGSIQTDHITNGNITLAKMAANSVDSSQYVDASIDHAHLANDCIDGTNIQDNAINSEHYTDDSIDNAHLSESLGDLRKGVTQIGRDTNDYINLDTTIIGFHLDGAEDMRLTNAGVLHVENDVIAFSTTISDERLKHDIEPITDALSKVGQLNGVTFTYNKDDKKSAGLIAQDVEKVMPSAVTETELPLQHDDGIAYKTVQYDQTIGLLVEAIKELTAKVEKLEKK